jgi:hypothetical protein
MFCAVITAARRPGGLHETSCDRLIIKMKKEIKTQKNKLSVSSSFNKMILPAICFVLCSMVYAENGKFTWNLGTIDIAWNHMKKTSENSWDAQKFSISIIDLQYHMLDDRIGIQGSILQVRKNQTLDGLISVFPVEVYANMLDSKMFLLGVYGRGEISTSDNGFYPYAEGGLKLGTMIINDPNKLKYSWKCSLYIGYDTRNEINIGTQIDIGVFGLIILWANSNHENSGNTK